MPARRSVVPDHDEHPGLEVLGARRMGGGPEAALDELVGHRIVGELPGGALAQDHVEERPVPGIRHHVGSHHFGSRLDLDASSVARS